MKFRSIALVALLAATTPLIASLPQDVQLIDFVPQQLYPGEPAIGAERRDNVSAPVAEITKLAQSGVGDDVVLEFIQNTPAFFDLTSDDIIQLHNSGISSTAIAAMIRHDRLIRAQAQAMQNQPAPAASSNASEIPPPAPADAGPAPNAATQAAYDDSNDVGTPQAAYYFYNSLADSGQWATTPNNGWAWQPNVASTPGWSPFCNNGQWIHSDAGWYWNSSYPWGWAAFHYGRWWQHPQRGWFWSPGRTWAPSWVTWRSSGDVSGWAPLPPGSFFDGRTGARFRRHEGSHSSKDEDFGLKAKDFTFVPSRHFGERNLDKVRLNQSESEAAFKRSRPVNNFAIDPRGGGVMNQGFDFNSISSISANPLIQANLGNASTIAGAGVFATPTLTPNATFQIFRPQIFFKPEFLKNPQPTSAQSQLINPVQPDPNLNPVFNTPHPFGNFSTNNFAANGFDANNFPPNGFAPNTISTNFVPNRFAANSFVTNSSGNGSFVRNTDPGTVAGSGSQGFQFNPGMHQGQQMQSGGTGTPDPPQSGSWNFPHPPPPAGKPGGGMMGGHSSGGNHGGHNGGGHNRGGGGNGGGGNGGGGNGGGGNGGGGGGGGHGH
ncbi:MAG: hypothetical protein JWR26_3299 [Pedosphaera sp.]|nr:hypothetical protein [Pedosphaera sp.]